MNKIYIQRKTGFASTDPGGGSALSKISVALGRTLFLSAIFLDDTDPTLPPVELAGGATGIFIVKPQNQPLAAALILNSAWVKQQSAGDGYVFSTIIADPSGVTTLTNMFTNSVRSIAFDAEILFTEDGTNYESTPVFTLQISLGEYQPGEAAIENPATMFPLPANIARRDGAGNILLGDGTLFRLAVVGNTLQIQKSADGGVTFPTIVDQFS